MTGENLNGAYRDRIEATVLEAIFAASMVEQGGTPTAVIMSAEAVDALLMVIAGLVATSDALAAPSGRRRFVERTAKTLRRRIESMRDHVAIHGALFATIHAGEELYS